MAVKPVDSSSQSIRQASQRARGPDALIGQKDAPWSRSICDRLGVAKAGTAKAGTAKAEITAYGPMLASSLQMGPHRMRPQRMGPQLVVNE